MSLTSNAKLHGLTTFNVDYRARYFLEVGDSSFIHSELSKNNLLHLERIFLGEGSNLLFTKDYPGVVIKVRKNYIRIEKETDRHVYITASGSFKWHDLVLLSVSKNLYGAENLSLIPGSVGGGVVQNIGAYGMELESIVESVVCIDVFSGKETVFNKDECNFAYRSSLFKGKKNLFIKEATFILSKDRKVNLSYDALRKRVLEKFNEDNITSAEISGVVCEIRREKLVDPHILPNCGSFFKNPIVEKRKFKKIHENFPNIPSFPIDDAYLKVSAGWLIEQVGLRGAIVNHAGTSPMHALILVKYPDGSGQDVFNFASLVKRKVFNKFDIILESEVEIH